MAFYLVVVGILAMFAFFDKESRRDLVKPEHSSFKVLAIMGMWFAADEIWGVPLNGYGALETIGIVTITVVVMLPVLLFGEYYTNKWWAVRREGTRCPK